MHKPLAGLLVVSVEQAVAAPMASRRLADAGARVIKLERPEGDFARELDTVVHGESAYFVWLNRGKQSVVADLSSAEGKRLLEALLAKADVFIQNLKPGALARLGFAPPDLMGRFPRLTVCSISGYGESGPLAKRKAYDLLIQAESGLASITGSPEAPSRVGVSVVDIATGMHAYEAILEALLARGTTGRGAEIQVSMFDCMAEWMAVPLLYAEYGKPPQRIGLNHPVIAPYGVFESADGVPILISIQNDREWAVLARDILQQPSLIDDVRFATNIARMENRAETDAIVARSFEANNSAVLTERLTGADIAFGRVNDVLGVLAHPQLRRVRIATPTGDVHVPAPPARVSGSKDEFGPVPGKGSHSASVRSEFLVSG